MIMKLIQTLVIIYLASNILTSCNSRSSFKEHVVNLETKNSNIKLYQGCLLQKKNLMHYNFRKDKVIGVISEDFTHKIIQNDTVIYLTYTYKPFVKNNEDEYVNIHFSKYYPDGEKFRAIELFNNDTLYNYTTTNSIDNSRFFIDYQFVSGKYFFMITHNSGFFNEAQMMYFYLNVDSLIKVRGNNLAELPRIDSISLYDFYKSEKYKNIINEKLYLK